MHMVNQKVPPKQNLHHYFRITHCSNQWQRAFNDYIKWCIA